MNQQNIIGQDKFQTLPSEEPLFAEQTVQQIPAVVPLEETPTRTAARFKRLRVPMRRENNSFNPAFMILALLAVTALGVIAGTLLYRTASETSANNTAAAENDEPINRTIPAQYQFVVDKPGSESQSAPKESLNSLSTVSAPSKKDSINKPESSDSSYKNNKPENSAVNEEIAEENEETEVSGDDVVDEEPPPPAPVRRERKEDKKQNKNKRTNNNAKPENQESNEPAVDEGADLDN